MRALRPTTATPGLWPAQTNASLVNGLACLLQVVSAGRPAGCRELARELGLEASRVNRLLGTLAGLGLLTRTPDRKYEAGSGLHVLAAMALRGSHLLGAALPHLEDLSRRCGGRGVALGVLWRRQVCYLFHGRTRHLEAAISHRLLYPAEESCIGQVLLAALPPKAVRALYHGTDEKALETVLASLETVRRGGFARNHLTPGSIAVALGDPPAAGLALMDVPAGTTRRLLPLLREAADAIERDLRLTAT